MGNFNHYGLYRTLSLAGILLLANLATTSPAVAEEKYAFSEKFMFRLSSYSVENADTDIAVQNEQGIGTNVSFAKDLGGESSVTIPRIDAFYRFNESHRIDFASFKIERDGRRQLRIDIDWDDQSYSIGETVVSDISYELLKIGYGYSFYHSHNVELGFTAGFNITSYEFNYQLDDGSQADSSDVTAPLPMFGLRMAYAITPKWSIHYLSETFFIEIGDELEGVFQNFELDLQYKAHKNFMLGMGVTRLSIDLEANDEEWRGRIADSHQGILLYLGYQL